MAAPAKTVRQVPTGRRLPDGYKTTIAFAHQPAVQFWEKSIMDPGFDGGEPIKITTMLETAYQIKYPRTLIEISDITGEVAYDPDCLPVVRGMINVPDAVTVWLPSGLAVSVWGYLRSFKPKAKQEGEWPLADIVVPVMNYDPVNNVEAGPVWFLPPGTP